MHAGKYDQASSIIQELASTDSSDALRYAVDTYLSAHRHIAVTENARSEILLNLPRYKPSLYVQSVVTVVAADLY